MDYKFPGRNVAGIMGSEKLVDSGYKTLLRSSCRARRLAWSWKDSLGWDWLCSSSKRSGVAVGSQVTKRPERHTEVDRAYGGEARQFVPGFFLSTAYTPPSSRGIRTLANILIRDDLKDIGWSVQMPHIGPRMGFAGRNGKGRRIPPGPAMSFSYIYLPCI